MCGICGIAGKYDKQKPVIENMMKSIYHRGPDGGGNYIDEDVALGFRRLSIIDLDCGNQPMFNETGEVVIVFNGEIYNLSLIHISEPTRRTPISYAVFCLKKKREKKKKQTQR